jgi:hypothetical protein
MLCEAARLKKLVAAARAAIEGNSIVTSGCRVLLFWSLREFHTAEMARLPARVADAVLKARAAD